MEAGRVGFQRQGLGRAVGNAGKTRRCLLRGLLFALQEGVTGATGGRFARVWIGLTLRPDGADTLVCIRVPPETGGGGEDSPSVLSGFAGSSFHERSSTDAPSVVGGTAGGEEEPWWLRATPLEPGPHVLELHSRIRDGGGFTAVERIRLAYLRGRQGASIQRGEDTHFTGARCNLRNRCYVVLAARHHLDPFFTWSVETHQRAVGEAVCRCVVVRAVESGALLCIPKDGLPVEVFDDAETGNFEGLVGPFMEVEVDAVVASRAQPRTLSVVILDVELNGFDGLSLTCPEGFTEKECKNFGKFKSKLEWPPPGASQELVQSGGQQRLEQYFSAAEELPPVQNGGGDGSTQELLHQLLSQAEVTQRMVTGMKDQFVTVKSRLDRLISTFSNSAIPKMSGIPGGGMSGVDEEENLDGEALDPTAEGSTLLQRLVMAKAQQSDPLSILGSATQEDPDMPKSSGVKGIAARQLLSDSFRRHPQRVVSIIRERLALARRKGSAKELEARDMWYHFQETVPLGSHKTLTYLAFISSAMFEAIERNDQPRLHMLAMLQAVFIEQAAYDGGALRLAHLLTCQEEPPFAMTELHKNVRSELAHAQLADPRWIATQLAFLKDLEGITDKSSKYVKPNSKPSDAGGQDDPPNPRPKYRPKKNRKTQEGAEVDTLFVASSNWLCMGRPRKLTQTWPPCSAAQRRMLTDLEHSLNLFYRLGRGPSSGLDRALGKFGSLSESLQQLTAASQSLRHQLDSYCRSRSFATHNFDATASEGLDGPTPSSSSFPQPGAAPVLQKSGSSALDLKPERIQFKQSPSFKPDKFISDPLLKAGFMDPKHLRLPKHLWPSPKLARVMCSRESLLELFQKWDDHNCLQLVEASESESKYRCGLFAVYKSEDRDRQILNPIPENSRCMTQNESTMTLAHGSLLCGLHLADSEDLLIGADDLEDFYHCFKVSRDHSLRNHIHGVFPGDTFKGWNAWSPDLSGKMVVGCFGTLVMGNSFAVELAQHTHTNLLSRAGVLKEAEQVCYRKPLPRSSTLQLLRIDDLAVLQKVPRGISASSSKCFRGDRELLEKAGNAYADAGLRTSAKKAVRDADTATILGGELDGRRGILSAPRLRIVTLSRLTLQLVKIGWATKNLMEVIIGSWIFVLLFRRPLLALFNDVFHEGEGCKSRHEIFKLSSGALQELMLVALWSPFAFTNLRAQPLDQIFCSDASLHGGGVCTAQFSREGTLELGRIAEQKGFYTRVDSSTLGRYLAAHGEDHVDPPGIPPSLQEGFLWDFCEIFRGVGTLSQAHAAAGLTVHPGFEIRDGPCGDVLHPATALAIIGLICRRVIRCFHVAPVCTTFGTLRRPRLRSKLMPYGFNPDEKHTHEGNQFAIRGGFILFLCHYYELLVSAEQPNGSVMFRLDLYQRLLTLGFLSVRFPFLQSKVICKPSLMIHTTNHDILSSRVVVATSSALLCPRLSSEKIRAKTAP
eukprot:symbB.v1.2.027349.t1/scaffold2783.1/size70499/2